ncbi:type II toxin-antitoxin system RelE/ParE family toxin [Ekhidna sp.]|uniref:type II toxin-antitoxin system RelE/ParE family toxin n=1 Tax=Ekhidna sp. TaxID=2608089 RepID=UPI003B5003D9
MAKRKVIWTQTAARQRRNVLEYWVEHNKSNSYSLKLLKASNSKTELIAKNPKIFREADFPETRIASMGHFSIFYKYNASEIIITAFWDNRQDPKKLLKLLKNTK